MLQLSFDPFPVLTTGRLTLRKMMLSDAADMLHIRSNPETMKFICRPVLVSISEAQQLISGFQEGARDATSVVWGISLLGESHLIGSMGFHRIDRQNHRAEVGYVIDPDFHGKGLASEALAAVIRFGFREMELHSIEARVDPRNGASSHVLVKQQFVREASFKEYLFFNGEFIDTDVYSLLRSNWQR